MTYSLDTNALSAIMRGDARMIARLRAVARTDVSIPQPVLAEIAYGIARLPRSRRRTALEERFALVRSEIVAAEWNDAVTDAFGHVKATLERKGQRIEDFDAAIAAHALATEAVLVTADAGHMQRIPGLVVENWTA